MNVYHPDAGSAAAATAPGPWCWEYREILDQERHQTHVAGGSRTSCGQKQRKHLFAPLLSDNRGIDFIDKRGALSRSW